MLCVGFVEEVIFRGFLFRAMEKDNVKTAIIVSSVTFGLGHVLKPVNGSGAGIAENLIQVTAAIAIGFLFVILFHCGESLLPCIITHSAKLIDVNEYMDFINEISRAPSFSDPMLSSEEQIRCNLLDAPNKPANKVWGILEGDEIIGLFVFLILEEESYIEIHSKDGYRTA